jgi:hypothetical protein
MTTERDIRIIAGTFVLASLAQIFCEKSAWEESHLAPSNFLPNQFRFCSLIFGGE